MSKKKLFTPETKKELMSREMKKNDGRIKEDGLAQKVQTKVDKKASGGQKAGN